MAERVPKTVDPPAFNSAVYSDRLQETRTAAGALAPVAVFDKTKPDSITPWVVWVREKLRGTVDALTEFTAAHEVRLNRHEDRLNAQNARIGALEAARDPFGSGSG